MKSQIEKGERYAAKGVDYLSRKMYWEAADEFTAALDFIAGVTGNASADKSALEKRVQWLVLRGDAWHGRQWYEDALEDYRKALQAMPALSLSPSMPEVEKKIETVIREGKNFNPYIGEDE